MRVSELEAITILLVRTQNTLYRMVVVDPPSPRILIQGGRFFPEPTAARFSGSSVGGSLLAIAWLGVGLRMEISFDGRRILTSPVRSVRIERPAALPGPF